MYKLLLLTPVVISLWFCSGILAGFHLTALEKLNEIPYGPIPLKLEKSYQFKTTSTPTFLSYDLESISKLDKEQFESIILSTLSKTDSDNLRKNLSLILEISEEHQIDPFWFLSIAMVESRFIVNAVSPKNARGLMQLKDDTALHLLSLLGNREDEVRPDLQDVKLNLTLGAFYLKKLLQNFRMDFISATVAYNVGPNRLKTLLVKKDNLDLSANDYYQSVLKNYQKFSRNYSNIIAISPSKAKSFISQN